MDARQIEYLLTVVEQGSLRGAAQQLGITQPALTKAIRRLEDTLGVQLFDRHSRGVQLNAFGKSFLTDAQDIHMSFRDALDRLNALRRGISGVINIGVGPFWQDAILPDAILEMQCQRPDVQFRIAGSGDDHLREMLKSRQLSFILAAGPRPGFRTEPGLVWKTLIADEYRVVADVGHPLHHQDNIAPEDLLRFPWILPPHRTYMVDRLRQRFRSAGLPEIVPSIETENIHLKFRMMCGTKYLSYHSMAHLSVHRPEFIRPVFIKEMTASRNAGLWKRQGASLGPADKKFVKIVERLSIELSNSLHEEGVLYSSKINACGASE